MTDKSPTSTGVIHKEKNRKLKASKRIFWRKANTRFSYNQICTKAIKKALGQLTCLSIYNEVLKIPIEWWIIQIMEHKKDYKISLLWQAKFTEKPLFKTIAICVLWTTKISLPEILYQRQKTSILLICLIKKLSIRSIITQEKPWMILILKRNKACN